MEELAGGGRRGRRVINETARVVKFHTHSGQVQRGHRLLRDREGVWLSCASCPSC